MLELTVFCYVRFASVYRQFRDIQTFMDELATLLKDQDRGNIDRT